MAELDRETAVRALVDQACRRGFAIAVHLLGNRADAEDAVQEAVTRSLGALDRLRDPAAIGGWFYRVLVNTCMRMLRRRRLADGVKRVFGARGEPVIDSDGLAPDQARLLVEIARLSPMQRTAIVLRHGEDLGIDEIARVMAISEETVKTHLKRARAKLRTQLGLDDE